MEEAVSKSLLMIEVAIATPSSVSTCSLPFLRANNVAIDQSLELFGDIETYNETLVEFQKGIDGKLERIDKFLKEGDMPNYAILVHSLKSDCKYFGFMELADIAYQHELESKASNINFVTANYEKLTTEAAKVRNIVNQYLSDDPAPEVAAAPAAPAPAPVANEKGVILVADDSEVIRLFVKKIFDQEKELENAKDGNEAIEVIKKYQDTNRMEAILLDLNMPGADGFVVLDYLRDNNLLGKMPVTIISGDSSSEAINKAFTYNIVDMLNKPFSEEKIKAAVEKTIAQKQ